MKNLFKLFGIIALVVVLGFVTTCGNPAGGGGYMTWTAVSNSTFTSDYINAIAYGNNKFVAGGAGGKMAYSTGY